MADETLVVPQITDEQRREVMRELSGRGVAARRAKRAKAVEEKIAELLAAAPPLTGEQRDRLAVLLRGDAA